MLLGAALMLPFAHLGSLFETLSRAARSARTAHAVCGLATLSSAADNGASNAPAGDPGGAPFFGAEPRFVGPHLAPLGPVIGAETPAPQRRVVRREPQRGPPSAS